MKKGQQKSRREPEIVGGGKGEIVIYQPTEGITRLEVRLEDDTLWLSLNQIADLFGAISLLFPGTCAMCSRRASLTGIQLLHFLQQLPRTVKRITSSISTSTPFFPSAIASIPCAARSFASGRPRCCGIIWSRAIRSMPNA